MKLIIYIINVLHHLIVWSMAVAPMLCWLTQPWYVAMPITMFLAQQVTGRCPLTDWENSLRKRHGMPEIKGGFVKYYYRSLL
jgi:hypothetical protein